MSSVLRAEREKSLRRRYGSRTAQRPVHGHGPGPGGPRGGGNARGGGQPREMKAGLKRLMAYREQDRLKKGLAFFCVLFSTVTSLAGAYMLRPIINQFIAPADGSAGSVSGLAGGLAVMAAVYMASVAASYLQSRIMLDVAQDALLRIRGDLFSRMQRLPVRFYDTSSSGDLMSRFTNDVDTIGNMLSSTLVQLFSGALSIVGTLGLMLYTNVYLTVITLVLIPLMLKAGGAVASRSQKYFNAQQSALGALNGYIEETISGQKAVKVFCHEDVAEEEFEILNSDLKDKQIRAQFLGGMMGPVMNNLSQINYVLTACVGGLLCVIKNFDVGGLTVFLNFSRQFSRPVNEISMQVSNVFSALAGAERVFAVMDEEPEPEDDPDAVSMEGMKGHVSLEHVYFGYDPGKLILKDISLYARPGQKIAFVGSTGAGKTTITNLLNRFYDIQSGSITIDGVDVRHIKREELRRNIAVVLQDTHLFTGTVMENIRYGRLDASDEEVIQAAKTASAHSFIMRLPKGYDTVLESDGANLSQGHRPGGGLQGSHPDPGRGHKLRGYQDREAHRAGHGPAHGGPDHLCHRPPALHREERQRHHGAGERRDHRAGGPRRSFGPEGTVLQPVYGQGRTGINLNMDLTFLSADLRLLSPWPLILHFFKYKGLKLTILLICKGFTNCTSY